jgi:hypothetical protein
MQCITSCKEACPIANKVDRDTGYQLEKNPETEELDSTLPLIETHAIIYFDPHTDTQVKIQAWLHGEERTTKDIPVDDGETVCNDLLAKLLTRQERPGSSDAYVHCDRLQETRGIKADNQIHMIFERR